MAGKGTLRRIAVVPSPGNRSRGMLSFGRGLLPCALGRGGVTHQKREGDGATPAGSHSLVMVYFRPDRVRRPVTGLPVEPIRADSGWCDDPTDRNYNRSVRLPYAAGHERLWRDDHLYDLCVVLDYNLENPLPGAGSAIFLHLATPDFAPTAGCVAVALTAMQALLRRADSGTSLGVG